MTTATAPNSTWSSLMPDRPDAMPRVALLGNPNTGKTTIFNALSGLRHKTSNFPGTTQEARIGTLQGAAREVEIIDLPGAYSLELPQSESRVCREVLAGTLAAGDDAREPDAVVIVADATNLPRNLVFVGEALRRRLPTLVVLNMTDLARARGLRIDPAVLASRLGCEVLACSARSGAGLDQLRARLSEGRFTIPNRTPPGSREGLEAWAEETYALVASRESADAGPARGESADTFTDRLDRVLVHPLWGMLVFAGVMTLLFAAIFKLATYPMDWIDALFSFSAHWTAAHLPEGILTDLLANGIIAGIGATVIFLPQICLLFFLISILEDTGYLARAALMMDRVLRPFGLPGHAFVPLLSSHACALPGIMACRGVPDRRERLATILVAPFMTCSARIPVYVLLTTLLFRDSPLLAALAFVGCYALGVVAGLVSALIARRTILRGASRPMAIELPTYKRPGLRNALSATLDRGWIFLKNAGTNILAICIVLWWLSSYPHVEPPARAQELRAQAEAAPTPEARDGLVAQAESVQASHALERSYAGRMGQAVQPLFAPLGFDWKLSIGVVTSFAAREVFVSTMAVVTEAGSDDVGDQTVLETVANARRGSWRAETLAADGTGEPAQAGPIFTRPVCWALLVYYVLAMQCLPTLAVTAREAGGLKWAALQLGWMFALAYAGGWLAFTLAG
ncbi:MAG: ferrous iron transporter B [Planctomycetota bacterium]|nr:ferrous iron transporter B [Planctomycetota bacterium]